MNQNQRTLSEIMIENNVSLRRLASRTGISVSLLSLMCNLKRTFRIEHKVNIANYFNLDMKSLLADRFYRIEYKIISGSGTTDETIQYFADLPSFRVVK